MIKQSLEKGRATMNGTDGPSVSSYSKLLLSVLLLIILASPLGCSCRGNRAKLPVVETVGGTKIVARTEGRYLEVHREDGWQRFTVKGANIGTALPGRWFSEFPANKELYRDWFEQIADMNANTVRVYTLLDPIFYETLDEFNKSSDKELLLLQEIWPNDEAQGDNLYDEGFMKEYRSEIAMDIEALLGKASIPERRGRAWGTYNANVFPYLLGILIGREITWEEASTTNEINGRNKVYKGRYVRTSNDANSVEAWMAEMCDFAVSQTQEKHDWQMPISYVSWPTLDPMVHPTEFNPGGTKETEKEDTEILNPSHLEDGPDIKTGLFACYHIYPYYPDFMNREPTYDEYSDEQGKLRYGGYLKQLMEILPSYPALIGEFGIPTSLGTAHINPEGFNHGGVSEKDQGEMIARMMDAIVNEGYAGGGIFEWADGWAKRTWVDMAYMIPFDRHIYWHNMMDPEQNFGILAFEPDHQFIADDKTELWGEGSNEGGSEPSEGQISKLYADADEAFLYLAVEFDGDEGSALLPEENGDLELGIGIDSFGRENGTTRLPVKGLPSLPSGVEFFLRIDGKEGARFLARPDYNRGTSKFIAASADDTEFEAIEILVNRRQVSADNGTVFPEIYSDESALNYGVFNPDQKDYKSLAHWYVSDSGDRVYIRIPWLLLNVSDPSSNTVLHDERNNLPAGPAALRVDYGRDALGTEKTEGFLFYIATSASDELLDYQPKVGKGFRDDVKRYQWPGWTEPKYRDRLKQSYERVTELFGGIE